MRGIRRTGAVLAVLLMCTSVALAAESAPPPADSAPVAAEEEELPSWPHEQQALLRQVEEELLDVRRKLFKARQMQDGAAIAAQGEAFQKLQEKRVRLLRATENQLPSE